MALAPHATAVEQAYIQALTARYAAVPPADRAPLDSAYATAMAALVRQYPNDLDAATLYAESLMDLRPWNYWQKDGSPYPGTDIIVTQLERVIAADPTHPGACHYYIHAVEAVAPEKAVACAERLAAEMPGAGHMVHMPAHIYIRLAAGTTRSWPTNTRCTPTRCTSRRSIPRASTPWGTTPTTITSSPLRR